MSAKRVLFLCTDNSARSQMAEGLLRHRSGGRIEAFSAGTEATAVRPLAITVCDDANESCPVFPNAEKRLHWSLPDPSKATGTQEQQLVVYRKVRDELMKRIERELAK